MRIALLASTFLPRRGGAEVVVHNLALQLRELGHSVTVITWWGLWRGIHGHVPYRVRPMLPGSFTMNDRTRWLEGRGRRYKLDWQIAAYQRLFRFHVWNIHMAFPASLFAVSVLNRMRVPVVTTCHGDDIFVEQDRNYGVRLSPHVDRDMRIALSNSDVDTAISTAMRAELLAIGVQPDRVTLIHNGVDARRIQRLPVHRDRVRQKLGIPAGVPVLITVGRNHPIKGYASVPAIARDLKSRGLNFIWLLVGDETDTLSAAVAEAGVSDRVKLLPGVSPLPGGPSQYVMPPDALVELYRASDAFVSVSHSEAFPLTWIEAMAAGLPVVAGDVMKHNDIVDHGQTGILVPKDDIAAMTNALARLIEDGDQRIRMRENAAVASSRFDWRSIANQYVAVYKSVVKQSPGRSQGG